MRGVLCFLGLLLVLLGPLLRVAEAAGDLARELDEPTQSVGLEEPDGGVGDHAGDSMRESRCAGCQDHSYIPIHLFNRGWAGSGLICEAHVYIPRSVEVPWPDPVSKVVRYQRPLC